MISICPQLRPGLKTAQSANCRADGELQPFLVNMSSSRKRRIGRGTDATAQQATNLRQKNPDMLVFASGCCGASHDAGNLLATTNWSQNQAQHGVRSKATVSEQSRSYEKS